MSSLKPLLLLAGVAVAAAAQPACQREECNDPADCRAARTDPPAGTEWICVETLCEPRALAAPDTGPAETSAPVDTGAGDDVATDTRVEAAQPDASCDLRTCLADLECGSGSRCLASTGGGTRCFRTATSTSGCPAGTRVATFRCTGDVADRYACVPNECRPEPTIVQDRSCAI